MTVHVHTGSANKLDLWFDKWAARAGCGNWFHWSAKEDLGLSSRAHIGGDGGVDKWWLSTPNSKILSGFGVLPATNQINVQTQMSVHDADSSNALWCTLAEETVEPFQNKAKVNIQSIKEGRILPWHWNTTRSCSRESTDGVLLCFCFCCASDFFFYHWQVNQRDCFSYSINCGL